MNTIDKFSQNDITEPSSKSCACSNCGAKLSINDKICSNCGVAIYNVLENLSGDAGPPKADIVLELINGGVVAEYNKLDLRDPKDIIFKGKALNAILAAHVTWLEYQKEGEQANLNSADLREANLREAKLKLVNLEKANLEGANLEGANLRGSNLRGANLRGANLERANLSRVDLCGANLAGANLQSVWLHHADLSFTNLQAANLQNSILHGAYFNNANLEGANFDKAYISAETIIDDANLKTVGFNDEFLEKRNQEIYEKGIKEANKKLFTEISKALHVITPMMLFGLICSLLYMVNFLNFKINTNPRSTDAAAILIIILSSFITLILSVSFDAICSNIFGERRWQRPGVKTAVLLPLSILLLYSLIITC